MPFHTAKLRFIKVSHTIAWAIFAGSMLIIPLFTWLEYWFVASMLMLLVLLEWIVLVFNLWDARFRKWYPLHRWPNG